MNHSIKSLVLMHVRASGPVSLASVDSFVRAEFIGVVCSRVVLDSCASLIQAEAIDLYDDDAYDFTPGPNAQAVAYQLDLDEGRGQITPNGPQVDEVGAFKRR